MSESVVISPMTIVEVVIMMTVFRRFAENASDLLKTSTGKRLTNSFKGDLAGQGLNTADGFFVIHARRLQDPPALNYKRDSSVSNKTI